jgi:hypothetical protein
MSATSGAAAGGNSPVASGATAEKIAEVVNKNHNLRPFSKDGLPWPAGDFILVERYVFLAC